MSDLINMTCPNCDAKLSVAPDAATLYCGYCGNEFRVRHSDGTIFLAPMAPHTSKTPVEVDKSAAELAVMQMEKEIVEIDKEIKAARKRDYSNKLEPSQLLHWLVVGIFLTFALFLVALSILSWWLMALAPGVTVILIVWYAVEYGIRWRTSNRLRQSDIENLQAERATKMAALESNRQIANN